MIVLITDVSRLRICRPLPPSELLQFSWTMPTVLNRMKNQFSDFYFLSYGWLYLQFTVTHLDFQVCHRPNKIVQKWSNLQERCVMSWNEMKNKSSYFQFLRYGRFCTVIKKKLCTSLSPPFLWGLVPVRRSPHRGLRLRLRMLSDWISLANRLSRITG